MEFSLHSQLREQFISRHQEYLAVDAISALCSSHTVNIDQELLDRHDDEERILCAICQEKMPIGYLVKNASKWKHPLSLK